MSDTSLWGRMKRLLPPPPGVSSAERQLNSYVVAGSQKAPVVRYLDALLGRLIERRGEMLLQAAMDLPDMGNAVSEALAYGTVVNRLKVLSGLYPVAYPKPTESSFKHAHCGRRYTIAALFADRGEKVCCRLSVTGADEEMS